MSDLYPVIHFANRIIEKSFEDKKYITLRKLQMLMYLSTSEYMKDRQNSLPIFSENFIVYDFGPGLNSIHVYFQNKGSMKISKYINDYAGGNFTIDSKKNLGLEYAISKMWEKFKNVPDKALFKIIRKEDSAWDKAFQKENPIILWADMYEDNYYND